LPFSNFPPFHVFHIFHLDFIPFYSLSLFRQTSLFFFFFFFPPFPSICLLFSPFFLNFPLCFIFTPFFFFFPLFSSCFLFLSFFPFLFSFSPFFLSTSILFHSQIPDFLIPPQGVYYGKYIPLSPAEGTQTTPAPPSLPSPSSAERT